MQAANLTAFAPETPAMLIAACDCAPLPGLPPEGDPPPNKLLELRPDEDDWPGFLPPRWAIDGLLEPQAASASSARPMSGRAISRRGDRTFI
jgi:hypothetical protein